VFIPLCTATSQLLPLRFVTSSEAARQAWLLSDYLQCVQVTGAAGRSLLACRSWAADVSAETEALLSAYTRVCLCRQQQGTLHTASTTTECIVPP
jgi:hypothetical protein